MACAICRPDLHVVDSELPSPKTPIMPGHGNRRHRRKYGRGEATVRHGDRVGIPWLDHTCGCCASCRSGQENHCNRPTLPVTRDGGFVNSCMRARESTSANWPAAGIVGRSL
ncbi:MAG: alcohol dehydrogenase catalytic domain-containing protein [Proteobacteria bacterium]|nr:alcohol dehydrogenase catalytic domain-containing protein [Pseudomonadota bacterium]